MDVRVGTIEKAEGRRIDAFELWCWILGLSPLDCKEIQPVHPKGNQSWIFIGRTDAEAETPILWPPDAKNWLIWWWERLKAGGEGDDRGWDGWMASSTWWTWVWVSPRSWWWTRKPSILQRVAKSQTQLTELNWTKPGRREGQSTKEYRQFNKRLRFLIWPTLPRTLLNHVLMWLHNSRAR